MGLRIKTNLESLIAQRRLGENRSQVEDSLTKLASGQRINKSADDAAGLAMSERLRARIRGLSAANRNANDGISYIQVAEGSLNEVSNTMVRMRELASQAASDTIGDREREFLNKEFVQLREEVDRIMKSTEFNGAKVLQIGDGDEPIQIYVGASNRGDDLNGDAPDIDSDNDPDVLNIDTSDLQNLSEKMETILEDDFSITVEGEEMLASELGRDGDTNVLFNQMDTALDAVADYRATLGSFQNRLESAITNNDIASENLTAANSRIRDVDFANETAKLAQAQILTQSGLSVLSQANQNPQAALQLLQ